MSQNGNRDPGWLTKEYFENRRKFPPEELLKYTGQYIAFSWDGTKILASGGSELEMEEKLIAAGIDPAHVVGSYVDDPDIAQL